MSTVPNDPFSEKPLAYAATSGGYTLKSVGANSAIAVNVP